MLVKKTGQLIEVLVNRKVAVFNVNPIRKDIAAYLCNKFSRSAMYPAVCEVWMLLFYHVLSCDSLHIPILLFIFII